MKQFESYRLDTANECLWRSGQRIELKPKPFAVLRYLVENPGRLITHDELLDALWPETFVQPQVLRTYMLELRKVLGDDIDKPRFIQTLPKRGYRFISAVTGASPASPSAKAGEAAEQPIVGREDELAQLAAELQRTLEGQRRLVFITGETGIGKTALAEAFCRTASVANTACVARGQCVEGFGGPGFGGKEEYYPVTEALNQLCASPDGEVLCGILGRLAPAWLALLRHERVAQAETQDGSRTTSRERMLGAICEALEEFAAQKALVLFFEDLHWADASTLNLISALARRRSSSKLMIVATCRPRDVAAEDPLKRLKQDLVTRRLCTEMAVAPLQKTAVKQFLCRELKQDALPSGLASFLHQHSEGNPLFLIALLEHLLAQRFLIPGEIDGARSWRLRVPLEEMDLGVPAGLAQMIELEIERMSPEEQRLLEAGSLVGMIFPVWAAAAAMRADAADVEEACEQLARRVYFLERAGQDELPDGTRAAFYVFAHGLYREVLCQRQPAAARSRRHRRIADRLSELFAGREASVARELATHYEGSGDWPQAVHALRSAAKRAGEREAWAECAELLEHALQLAGNMSAADREKAARQLQKEIASAKTMLADGISLPPKV
ncbi:AAA family ATPase [Paracidobacterium acidisoli]|uniref:OmpR/PhoB-type domain-containing protein n=1 Tax=Paracidobacterium acidisoli TaxID=2303751 RepID=A0A372ITW6_9BACT|nr:AAA family ATPase [Paracidobacterium acidisoli]MBT9329789.1 AAA family ATPase [Paracidobacterium acidisoli]